MNHDFCLHIPQSCAGRTEQKEPYYINPKGKLLFDVHGQYGTGLRTQLQATNERNECNKWRPRVAAVMSHFEEAPCHCFVVAACVRREAVS